MVSSSQTQLSGSANEQNNSNVKVVVRIRPENNQELEGNSRTVVKVLDEHVLVFDPKEEATDSFFHGKRIRNILQKKNKDMRFAFDRVFDASSTQQEVYENTTKEIIDGVLNGYNCSVFAYGATGAGKTFTMLGSPESPGVMFNTMVELYKRIDSIKEEKTCNIAISYLEVYNENIRDLLNPGMPLAVREDSTKGVVVSGLSLHQPSSAEDLLHMLEYGNQNRTQHPTDANAQSSRSHAVFQVFVRQKARTAGLSADVKVAKMSLIDLAGSERATVTTNRGARFREGANINKSLLALGNCINALANPKNKGQHIPYRDSKLTRLLKDSLGGNCRTVMIAAVSPSHLTFDDTYNTLKYADRAKNIRSNLKSNVVSVDFHVTKYVKIVQELRTEITELKVKLKSYEEGNVQARKGNNSKEDEGIVKMQDLLMSLFIERSSIRRELMELESCDRDLTVKIARKERHKERLHLVNHEQCVTTKMERVISASRNRQCKLQERKILVDTRMQNNSVKLEELEKEMTMLGTNGEMPDILRTTLRMRHLAVELKDRKRMEKHLKKVIKGQNNELQSSERLIHSLLLLVQEQHFILKGSDKATYDIVDKYESIMKSLEGTREVVWADQPNNSEGEDNNAPVNTNMEAIFNIPILSCASASPFVPRSNRRKTRNEEDSSDTAASSPISALRVVKKDNSACTNVCASKGPSRIFTQTNASHTPKRFGIPNKENNEVDSSCVSTLKQPPVHLDSVSYADVAKRLTPKLPRTSAAELALGNYPSRSASATSLAMGSSRSSSNMMSRLASVDAFSSGTPSTSNTARSSKASNLTNTATRSSMSRLQRSNTFNKAVHTINDTTNVHSSSSTRFSMVNVYTKTQNSKNQSTVATSLPSLSRNSDFAIEGVCPLRSPSLSPSVPPHIVASGDLTSPDSLSTTFTCGSPVGTGQKMSYAQVVSTPQRVSPRTPLSCISNSPVPFNLDVEIMPSKQEKKDACNTRPDKSTSAFGFKRLKPTYMMMTKSAASKRKGHRRSLSSGDITSLPAGRVPKIKGSASSRMSKPSLSRSRSYGNLHR